MKYSTILLIIILLQSCKSPRPRLPEQVNSGSFIKQSAIRNKKLNAQDIEAIKNLIKNDTINEYLASENGFWYYYNTKIAQDTIKPLFGDLVEFQYSVSHLNGAEIYSKKALGPQRYMMDQEELFKGLREGLKLMKPEEEVTFIFPSQIAYGYYGDDNKIGTNVSLICNVTLNNIIKTNNE